MRHLVLDVCCSGFISSVIIQHYNLHTSISIILNNNLHTIISLRFKEYLGGKGPKVRQVPLSPADEKHLVDPTAEEIKEAEMLRYNIPNQVLVYTLSL